MSKDCWNPKVVCFGCGQTGHIKTTCPNKGANPGPNNSGGFQGAKSTTGSIPVRSGDFKKPGNGKFKGKPFGRLNCRSAEQVA